jgi:hypothetical protein
MKWVMFLFGMILVSFINGGWILITDYFTFKDDRCRNHKKVQ